MLPAASPPSIPAASKKHKKSIPTEGQQQLVKKRKLEDETLNQCVERLMNTTSCQREVVLHALAIYSGDPAVALAFLNRQGMRFQQNIFFLLLSKLTFFFHFILQLPRWNLGPKKTMTCSFSTSLRWHARSFTDQSTKLLNGCSF